MKLMKYSRPKLLKLSENLTQMICRWTGSLAPEVSNCETGNIFDAGTTCGPGTGPPSSCGGGTDPSDDCITGTNANNCWPGNTAVFDLATCAAGGTAVGCNAGSSPP